LEHPHNYEESIRKLEHTEGALKEKELLKKFSLEKGANIDVRLFVGQVPKDWNDEKINEYFGKLGTILEARVIRDKFDGTHRGCAFLRCKMYHEAELILDSHKPRAKRVAEDAGLISRLQLRFADGELERLGIVNIDK
jgi:CUG-BP- and ETR3-like factor